MRAKIKEYNGGYAVVHFFPDSEQEQKALSAFKNNNANDSIELAVIRWAEKAILDEGLGKHSVVGFEGVQNNLYYIFKVQKEGSIGGF
ncbi:MAG: hypothetical protein AAGF85_07510 [Bacteroidota bacterium]